MKIVIEIQEDKYKRIVEKYDTFPAEMKEWGLNAIKNGTPLPKGHGDLIDRSKIKFFGCDVIKNCHSDCSICSYAGCYRDDVMSLPKIVPADKESEG